ncbi:TetR/AcrR family transcriptional regulator [Nocardioides mangrovi]|uniref:TetR/AcrR family transcriptional regulator n=1 Tax=Nocardioides mangrovi TaxID=2874580 RepID=A0ABS7U814_9ACTN|nr:TetR/AcrR family transcriptional regulator [Nocardioides mangrovi]MBZ5736985.1 TetR/AcrR family transcriptional regulator [Nocardioides mangrovi]
MGRWEPNARGRLEEAALELFAEHGYDQTTVAQIADRAGLTERTFYRHFADKREVLFGGGTVLEEALAAAVREAPAEAAPYDVVAEALVRAASFLDEQRRDHAPRRQAVIEAHAELRERELGKMAAWVSTLADGLRERGVEPRLADLIAETGVAVFRTAFATWVTDTRAQDLRSLLREAFADLRAATAG